MFLRFFVPNFKGKYLFISWFVTCYCLKMAPKIDNNSKFTRKLEIFAKWTVDSTAQYHFIKTDCISKNSQIPEFQNHIQTKSNLHTYIYLSPGYALGIWICGCRLFLGGVVSYKSVSYRKYQFGCRISKMVGPDLKDIF